VACRDFGPQLTKRSIFLPTASAAAAIGPPSSGGNCLAAMTMHSMSERASVRMPCTSRFLLTVPPTTASPRRAPAHRATSASARHSDCFAELRAIDGSPYEEPVCVFGHKVDGASHLLHAIVARGFEETVRDDRRLCYETSLLSLLNYGIVPTRHCAVERFRSDRWTLRAGCAKEYRIPRRGDPLESRA
jgi:hypothetical protein